MTRALLHSIGALLLVAVLPGLLSAVLHSRALQWSKEHAGVPEISAEWVKERRTVLWVDAREETAFRRDAVPGAVNLNESLWDDMFPEFLSRWQPGVTVIVYCDERCSSSHEVARRLRHDTGIVELYVLRGGRAAWTGVRRS